MTNITHVFIVDDDEAVRDSLSMMLKAADLNVSTFMDAEDFLATCKSDTEGCIILDVNMPGMDGLALQDELNRCGVKMPIIFLTGQGSIPLSVRTIKAGAMDFLTKPVNGDELLDCVKQALDKCSQLHCQALENRSMAARFASLTEREKEVMMLVIEGLSSKEMAEHLGISYRTIENHRAHVMRKTGSSNMLELARIASCKTSQ